MRRPILNLSALAVCLISIEVTAQPTPASAKLPAGETSSAVVGAASTESSASAVDDLTDAKGRALTLSPMDAVRRALQRSPTRELAPLSAKNAAEQVRAELGRYPYLLLAEAGTSRSESPQLRADDSVAATVMKTVDGSLALRRTFPTGTVAEVRASEQCFNRDITQVTVNPFLPANTGHAATLSASVTQPLMRGAGTDIGEVELRAARISRDVSQRALQRVESALIRDVLSAYCELWYANQALAIERQA